MGYEMLFSPIAINQMQLQHRVIGAPTMDYLASEGGFVTPEMVDFWLRRARGGVSMLIIGNVVVGPVHRWHRCISDDKFIPGLRKLVDQVHAETDAKICAQLCDWLPSPRGHIPDVHAVTREEIERIVDNFVNGAIRAGEAGFDAIEFDATGSYALSAFLSRQNKRGDEYGGSIDNRMRVVTEVYQRSRKALGVDYPIGIRINGDDFTVSGNTLAHSTIFARRLASMGVDYISLSAGGMYEDMPDLTPVKGRLFPYPPTGGYSGLRYMPPAWMPEAVNVYLAEAIRKALRQAGYSIPVMTAGRIPYPELAEAILQEGKADLIGLCRPLLRDPDWPMKARQGRSKKIARCEYCNTCMERLCRQEPAYCKHEKGEEDLKRFMVATSLGEMNSPQKRGR